MTTDALSGGILTRRAHLVVFCRELPAFMVFPCGYFYVNRGQAITSFGVTNKDNPIMEFQPANKAYRTTATTGFPHLSELATWGRKRLLRTLLVIQYWGFDNPFDAHGHE